MHFYCSLLPLQVLDTYLRPKQHRALKCTIRSIAAVSKTVFPNRNPDYSRNYTAIRTAQQQQGHRTFLFIYSAATGTVANFLFALLASIFTLISTRGFHIFGYSIVSNYKRNFKGNQPLIKNISWYKFIHIEHVVKRLTLEVSIKLLGHSLYSIRSFSWFI